MYCARYSNTTLLFRWHNHGFLFFLSKRDYWTNKYPVSLINVSHYRNKIGCHFMLTLYMCTFKQNDYLNVNISHSLSHYMRSSACVIIINIWRLLSFDISCQLYTHITYRCCFLHMIAKYASLDFWHLLETCCHQVVVDKYTTPSPRENK